MIIPKPTGAYGVGTFTYTVKDDRVEVMNPPEMRSVAARVYYPVPKDRTEGCTKARYMSKEMAEGIRKIFKLPLNYDKMENVGENLSECFTDAPKAEGEKFPISFNKTRSLSRARNRRDLTVPSLRDRISPISS